MIGIALHSVNSLQHFRHVSFSSRFGVLITLTAVSQTLYSLSDFAQNGYTDLA